MGDKYVNLHIGSTDVLPEDQGYHFLFENPLSNEMFFEIGWQYE